MSSLVTTFWRRGPEPPGGRTELATREHLTVFDDGFWTVAVGRLPDAPPLIIRGDASTTALAFLEELCERRTELAP